MQVFWTEKGLNDLQRIHNFAAQHDRDYANDIVDTLVSKIGDLVLQPRIGVLVAHYEPREVRKTLFNYYEIHYEIHYEISSDTLYVIDLWHTREDRSNF